MTKPKAPGKKSVPAKQKPDLKIQKVQARWTFTDKEIGEIAREGGRAQNDITSLDESLSSIKSDFKSKIESAENRRNDAFRKIEQGFEMREIEAIVIFNAPTKGRKSIFRYDSSKKGGKGEFVIEEPMTPADCQQELFDAEKPGMAKGESPEFSDDIIKTATEAVRKNGKASIAFLQKTLTLGYTRSSKLMAKLEELKVVGPSKGSEPRDIIAPTLNPVIPDDIADKLANPPTNDAGPVKSAAQIKHDLQEDLENEED